MGGDNNDDDSNDNGNNHAVNGNYHWIEWLSCARYLATHFTHIILLSSH